MFGINPKTIPTFAVGTDAVTGQRRRTPGVLTSVLMWWGISVMKRALASVFQRMICPK